jgi:SPP1 family predicted phage head-tail adaptor
MQPFKYKPNMNSGLFRHRIKILRPPDPEKDIDEAGQPLDFWPEVTKTWADIYPLRGRELFSAQQEHAEVTTRITIRYQEGVDRSMKVDYEKTEFEILYIIHKDFRGRELQLLCKERQ